MLQVCPAMDCGASCDYHQQRQRQRQRESSHPYFHGGQSDEGEDPNSVIVDVGQVDEQVATLWWALAQQTARVARRCTGNSNTTQPVVDAIRSTSNGWIRNAWAPVTSLSSRSAASPEATILGYIGPTAAVVDLTLSRCNSSNSSNSIRSDTMSTTPMSSPRLVREISEKFPPSGQQQQQQQQQQSSTQQSSSETQRYPSYIYDTSPSDTKDGVQLLRYVRNPQSSSADQLPTTESQARGSIRRPKSEVAIRKFSDSSGHIDDAGSTVDCVQYEGQDIGRYEDDPASGYAPIVVVVSITLLLRVIL